MAFNDSNDFGTMAVRSALTSPFLRDSSSATFSLSSSKPHNPFLSHARQTISPSIQATSQPQKIGSSTPPLANCLPSSCPVPSAASTAVASSNFSPAGSNNSEPLSACGSFTSTTSTSFDYAPPSTMSRLLPRQASDSLFNCSDPVENPNGSMEVILSLSHSSSPGITRQAINEHINGLESPDKDCCQNAPDEKIDNYRGDYHQRQQLCDRVDACGECVDPDKNRTEIQDMSDKIEAQRSKEFTHEDMNDDGLCSKYPPRCAPLGFSPFTSTSLPNSISLPPTSKPLNFFSNDNAHILNEISSWDLNFSQQEPSGQFQPSSCSSFPDPPNKDWCFPLVSNASSPSTTSCLSASSFIPSTTSSSISLTSSSCSLSTSPSSSLSASPSLTTSALIPTSPSTSAFCLSDPSAISPSQLESSSSSPSPSASPSSTQSLPLSIPLSLPLSSPSSSSSSSHPESSLRPSLLQLKELTSASSSEPGAYSALSSSTSSQIESSIPLNPSPLCKASSTSSPSFFCSKRTSPEVDELIKQFGCMDFAVDKWTLIAQKAQSDDENERYDATKNFRIMLSVSGEIPIQAVIDTGIVPVLTNYLGYEHDSDLQFEAAWALTNIASGTSLQTEVVVVGGAIEMFLKYLLGNEKEELCEQGMWGLGNIAGDRAEFRDAILAYPRSVELFVNAIKRSKRISSIRTGVWALSNLCRGRPKPSFSSIYPAIHILVHLVKNSDDREVLADACWAIDGVADTKEGVHTVVSSGILPFLLHLIDFNSTINVQRPALRVIGQIATGDVREAQEIIDHGCVPSIIALLNSPRRSIRKDASWILSNLAVGSPSQLQALIKHNTFPSLMKIFLLDDEPEVRKEAAWTICNAVAVAKGGQLQHLFSMEMMAPICHMLMISDTRGLDSAMDALINAVKFGDYLAIQTNSSMNPVITHILETDGLSQLRSLSNDPTHRFEIAKKVEGILRELHQYHHYHRSWQ